MDPAYLNPIVPVLPDVGRALVVPALLAAVGVGVGLAVVVVLVARSDAAPRRAVEPILDVDAPIMLDPNGSAMARRSGGRSFVHWVRREPVDVRELRVGPALRR